MGIFPLIPIVQSGQSGEVRKAEPRARRATRARKRLAAALVLGACLVSGGSEPLRSGEPDDPRPQIRTGVRLQAKLLELAADRAESPAHEPSGSDARPAEIDAPPTAESAAPGEVAMEITPFAFQGVTPGETSDEELRQLLGDPSNEPPSDADATWTYSIGPFPKVEFRFRKQVVESIRIHLAEPMTRKKVLADLALETAEPALLVDPQGLPRGEMIPERGMRMHWLADSDPPLVAWIHLSEPNAELFVRRAQLESQYRYQRMLSDLAIARRLDPRSTGPMTLEARLRLQLGQPTAALELSTAAVQLDGRSAECRLLHAEILAACGRHQEGLLLAEKVAGESTSSAEIRAQAASVRGRISMASPNGNPKTSFKHFQAAIKLAEPLAADPRPYVRRASHQVLVESYLGGALSIAQGSWQNRAEAVDGWWTQASSVSQHLDPDASIDSLDRWELKRRQLAIASYAGGRMPIDAIDDLRLVARRLNDRSGDSLLANRLDWELAEALLHAAEISQSAGLWPEAHEFATEGLRRAEAGIVCREINADTDYLLGRLEFLVGAFHAVVSKDQAEIKFWFDKAGGHLNRPADELSIAEQSRQGERLVFMGQSYQGLGELEPALRYLARGVETLEPLADQGVVPKARAAAAIRQLAALHRTAGKSDSAKELTARAERLTRTR